MRYARDIWGEARTLRIAPSEDVQPNIFSFRASATNTNTNYIIEPPLELGTQKKENHADSIRNHRTKRALRSKSPLGRAP